MLTFRAHCSQDVRGVLNPRPYTLFAVSQEPILTAISFMLVANATQSVSKTVESAQPRNRSTVTRPPLLKAGSGHETIIKLLQSHSPLHFCVLFRSITHPWTFTNSCAMQKKSGDFIPSKNDSSNLFCIKLFF